MSFLNLFNKNNDSAVQNSQHSRYEHLPLVNPKEDRNTPKGYVERKFITEEKVYQQCTNVFYESSIPIVNECKFAIRYLGTLVLQNPNGQKVRSVTEIIYYPIPDSLKQNYLNLISQLNNLIMKYELPLKYLFSLDKIIFSPPSNGAYKIPLSYIQYNQEKNELYFIFANEVKTNGPYKYSTPVYESTESGSITYTQDGNIKKAEISKLINGKTAKIRFKNYKAGFDLYDIRYNGNVVYKRESK